MMYYDVQEEKNLDFLKDKKSKNSNGFIKFRFFDYGDIELFHIFIEKPSGLMYLDTRGQIFDPSILKSAVEMVTKEVKKMNLIPQINIVKNNSFLQTIATACNFKKIPTLGKFKFTIWKYCEG